MGWGAECGGAHVGRDAVAPCIRLGNKPPADQIISWPVSNLPHQVPWCHAGASDNFSSHINIHHRVAIYQFEIVTREGLSCRVTAVPLRVASTPHLHIVVTVMRARENAVEDIHAHAAVHSRCALA